jgi:ribosomal protein L44E
MKLPALLLFCPTCQKHTAHELRPWQTMPNVMGALTTLCRSCSRLTILNLEEGHELLREIRSPHGPNPKEGG